MPLHTIHFTLHNARTLLPHVRPIVEEIVRLKRDLDAKGFDVYRHQYFGGMGPNGLKRFPAEMEQLVVRIQSLDKMGVVVKGLDQGLIDFPHMRKGEEVYLCWMLGEHDIDYWHPIETGFAGRRPISEL